MRMLTMFGLAALSCATAFGAEIKNGETIAFLGDSITQQGWIYSSGYIRMCEAAFKANDLKINIIPAGVGGHKSNNMLARLDYAVLSKKPTYMTIMCGGNDVWQGPKGVELEDYKKNMTEIVAKTQKAGIKVIIMTATMIQEDTNGSFNKKLAAYNDFIRQLAKEKQCTLVELNSPMQKQVAELRARTGLTCNLLTVDGVHMDFLGNLMMAENLLKDGFGFTEPEMAKFKEAVKKIPHSIRLTLEITGAEYMALSEKALGEKTTVDKWITPVVNKFVKDLAK